MQHYHLTAIIDTMRHGEKDAQGELTVQGHIQAAMGAVSVKDLKGTVQIYHSGVPRVVYTVAMVKALMTATPEEVGHEDFKKKVEACMESCKMEDMTVAVREELQLKYPGRSTTYFSSWKEQANKEEAIARAEAYLAHHDISPDPENMPSPKETARRVTRLLLEHIRASMATPCTQRDNIINGTHEPVLLAFLGYALSGFQHPAPGIVAQWGGSIAFAEGFQIHVYQSEDNQILLQLHFRDFLLVFSVEDLEAFLVE